MECGGELSAGGTARRQMKKCMAMRSDEGDVGEQDVRASGDLDGGVAELAAEREVECGNRSGADFSSAEAASNSLRKRVGYGKVWNAIKRAGGRARSSSSTTTALTPSCEVPDIRPIAKTLPRSRLILIALIFIRFRIARLVFVIVQIVRTT